MNIGVIFAGGSGKRMNTRGCPKQFLKLNDKPILVYTIEVFENHPSIDAIVCVCLEEWIPHLKKMLHKYGIEKVVCVTPGGDSGQESIYQGLCAAEGYANERGEEDVIVLIHDGVRPLITEDTISDNIQKVKECGSCITCIPAIETVLIKNAAGTMFIPERSDCMMARAPQSFYLKDIIAAHRMSREEKLMNFIDSCSLMHHYGYNLGFIQGPMENIKITTPSDYFVLRAMIEVRENQQIFGL